MLKSKRVASMGGYVFVAALCAAFLFSSPVEAVQKKVESADGRTQGAEDGIKQPVGLDVSELIERLGNIERELRQYKDVEQVRRETSEKGHEKLLGNINTQIDLLSLCVGAFGAFITIVAFAGGFFIYKGASADARTVAEQWVNSNAGKIEDRASRDIDKIVDEARQCMRDDSRKLIEKLEADIKSIADDKIRIIENTFCKKIDVLIGSYADRFNVAFKKIENVILSGEGSEKDEKTLREIDTALKHIPEASYNSQQLYARGVVDYHAGSLDSSVEYFRKASEADDASQVEVARSLFNMGVALWKLNRIEDSLDIYSEILNRFEFSVEIGVVEQVAKTLINQCGLLDQLKKYDDALNSVDDVLRRLCVATNPALVSLLAKAMINKGSVLVHMERFEEAMSMFKGVIHKFSGSKDSVLIQQVVFARNGIGFVHVVEAKKMWGDKDVCSAKLREAKNIFEKILSEGNDEVLLLGNLGYVLFLLGRREDARAPLLQALDGGGEFLYKAEVEDSLILPVPEDEDFRKLLAELWREAHGTEPPVIEPPKKDEATPPSSS